MLLTIQNQNTYPNQVLEMDLMSRTDLFDRLQELDGAFTEPEAAGMARNLLLAVRHRAHAYVWIFGCVE